MYCIDLINKYLRISRVDSTELALTASIKGVVPQESILNM